jgi:ribonuclease E
MPKKMLIDAAHPEETRVVVVDGSRVEEFDFESRARKQLRGNIYLAKVTRVEPSLQAAFVEYGGNRHGFLAFNEIHPDYYQIPHADREALMREADEDDDEHTGPLPSPATDEDGEIIGAESLGGDDEDEIDEEIARRRRRLMRRYKIQEVIKRRQIMLIQVVKEERGNKGAALTTYLSLAGRYCVLMPNTDRGGGISRKITAATDRKRLRSVVAELDVPEGMGLIVRTAGAKRTKAEIKRDYEYLSRAWSNIRDTTLHSIAPALIYEEEDLVKRAIRDLYEKDIEGIWVEGEAGFREARDFMRMLMPSQAKKVLPYRQPTPLFVAHKIEDHLSQIYSPVAPLRSGGYLVINQTEALVAIDVNSGRATRERNIEATALKTNLEAAEEAARQLRLRDLAGLIVIDFIDMDEGKNNRAVEKVLKDCLARDRARIQVGKISPFGLMEISRQRRRTGILEGTTNLCPHCHGAGRVRSVESSALAALRAVEMEALKGGGEVTVRTPRDVGLYILNNKREYLTRLLRRNGLFVSIVIDDALSHADHEIERISDVPYPMPVEWEEAPDPSAETQIDDEDDDFDDDEGEELDEIEAFDEDGAVESDDDEDDDADDESVNRDVATEADSGRRSNRRRRRGRREDPVQPPATQPRAEERPPEGDTEGEAGRRRRRGRRGGRRPRDDARAADVYAWSWPARLSGDDPYEWRGPIERSLPVNEPELTQPSLAAPAPTADRVDTGPPAATSDLAAWFATPPETQPFATNESSGEAPRETDHDETDDIWVELPSEPEKPSRPRRSRDRSRRTPNASSDTPAPVDEEDDSEPGAPAPTDVDFEATAVETKAVEAMPEETEPHPLADIEPQPAMVAEVEPSPTVPAVPIEPPPPDPAEISAPPAAPRRGWWRRSV